MLLGRVKGALRKEQLKGVVVPVEVEKVLASAEAKREAGNAKFKAGDYDAAVQEYDAALITLGELALARSVPSAEEPPPPVVAKAARERPIAAAAAAALPQVA